MMKLELGRLAVVLGLFGVATVGLAAAGVTDTSATGAANVPDKDRDFLKEAAQGGLAEVQMGQYMRDHTTNSDVKQYAQRLVDDHTKANDQIAKLGQQKGCTLPTDIGKHQDMMNKMMQLSGYALDRMYITDMVRDHETDVAAFQHEAGKGKDADIRQFAQSTLPTLKEHLSLARTVDAQLKKSQTATR